MKITVPGFTKKKKEKNSIFMSGFFPIYSDPAVHALQFLDVINMKDPTQKAHFYRNTLREVLPFIPRVSDFFMCCKPTADTNHYHKIFLSSPSLILLYAWLSVYLMCLLRVLILYTFLCEYVLATENTSLNTISTS